MNILLVEDDISIQSIAKLSLTRIGNHKVWLANDGLETLVLLETHLPDLILLDVMMPHMNGFDTCAQLKADYRYRDIPIIFLTAKAQMHEIKHGMDLGAIGYILKPFDPMTLHIQIEELLDAYAKTKNQTQTITA